MKERRGEGNMEVEMDMVVVVVVFGEPYVGREFYVVEIVLNDQ